ncbi:P-loop containing nucleoside triphosphate hydrolase protein [Penicillium sp. IBT 35674x]|nr:P-loop containing nucleoside triphosphate hydrolase protein [Penicillium sp. IBT 35674x]
MSNKNTAKMEILVLGLPRTGTQSLAGALNLIGYEKVYHMKDNFIRGDHTFWSRAMDAKFAGQGNRVNREDFDKLFGGEYRAVSDYPAAMFPDELIASYPSAKVILLSRDQDEWIKSMENTLLHAWNAEKKPGTEAEADAQSTRFDRDEMVRKIQTYAWNDDFEANGRKLFVEHNEHVRQLMKSRPGDFLELNVVEGWQPLCRFLEKQPPSEGFPRQDDWVKYKKDVQKHRRNDDPGTE